MSITFYYRKIGILMTVFLRCGLQQLCHHAAYVEPEIISSQKVVATFFK